MFGFFLTGICLAFILIFLSPVVMLSRWWSLPLAIIAFIDTVLVTVASIIGTVMSVVAQIALTAQSELNLRADIGVQMMVFMWIASVMTIVAFFIHAIMGCCCRIDRGGSASGTGASAVEEKKANDSATRRPALPDFLRRRKNPRQSTSTSS